MIREGNGLDYLIYSDADIDFNSSSQTQTLKIKDPLLDNSHSYNIDNFISYIGTEEKSSQTFLAKIEENKSKFVQTKIIANLETFHKLVTSIIHNLDTADTNFANLDTQSYIQELIKTHNDKINADKLNENLLQAREFKQLKTSFEGLNAFLTKNFANDTSVKLLRHDYTTDIKQKVYVSLKE